MTVPQNQIVTAAFAHERDAGYAIRLVAQSPEIEVRFVRRNVLGERGEIQMVLLEATLSDPAHADRVETCMAGAHGVRIAPESEAAQASWAS